MIAIGDKVVCVDGEPHPGREEGYRVIYAIYGFPKKGSIYTVSNILITSLGGVAFEIDGFPTSHNGSPVNFGESRFCALEEYKPVEN